MQQGARGRAGHRLGAPEPMPAPRSLPPNQDASPVASLVPLRTLAWLWQNRHSLARHVGSGPAHRRARVGLQFKLEGGTQGTGSAVSHTQDSSWGWGPLLLSVLVANAACLKLRGFANPVVPWSCGGSWGSCTLRAVQADTETRERVDRAPGFHHPHWGASPGRLCLLSSVHLTLDSLPPGLQGQD